MSTQPDSFRHLEAGLNRYRQARRSDKKRGLFGLTPWLLRLIREKDRQNKALIAMVAGVSVRSLWGSTSVREPTNRGRGDAMSSRRR